jgi:hypothetical protein
MNEIEVMMAGTHPFFTKVCFGNSVRTRFARSRLWKHPARQGRQTSVALTHFFHCSFLVPYQGLEQRGAWSSLDRLVRVCVCDQSPLYDSHQAEINGIMRIFTTHDCQRYPISMQAHLPGVCPSDLFNGRKSRRSCGEAYCKRQHAQGC